MWDFRKFDPKKKDPWENVATQKKIGKTSGTPQNLKKINCFLKGIFLKKFFKIWKKI